MRNEPTGGNAECKVQNENPKARNEPTVAGSFMNPASADILGRMTQASSMRVVKSYKVLVGLEIHVQLATRTKIFTSVANGATNFGAEPNSLVDQQILGLPGVLPVMNKKAVESSIMVGLALGCKIAKHTKWDRKSY